IGDELHECFARLDILFDLGRIGGMELAGGARTPDLNAGVGEALPNFPTLRLAEAWLDAVFVRRSQFDRRKADLLAYLEDGGNIPVGSDIVSHDAKPVVQRRLVTSLSQRRSGSRNAGGSQAACSLQETAAIDGSHAKRPSVYGQPRLSFSRAKSG